MLLFVKAKNLRANVKKTPLLIYIHRFSTTDADVGTENVLELLEQRKKKSSDILAKLKPSLQPVSTFYSVQLDSHSICYRHHTETKGP